MADATGRATTTIIGFGVNLIVSFLYLSAFTIATVMSRGQFEIPLVSFQTGLTAAVFVLFGWRFLSGIFLGAILAGLQISLDGPPEDLIELGLLVISSIAPMIYGLFARYLIFQVFGRGIMLRHAGDAIFFFVLAGPIASVVLCAADMTAFFIKGEPSAITLNALPLLWLSHVAGVAIVSTVAVYAPFRPSAAVHWCDRRLVRLSRSSFLIVFFTCLLSFGGWLASYTSERQAAAISFEKIADDAQDTLRDRMHSYFIALSGAAGLMSARDSVTFEEWKVHVDRMDIESNLPSILGLGYIVPVGETQIDAFLDEAMADGVPNIQIHPLRGGSEKFVIKYIEPLADNQSALGLNIAFESNRYRAAITSRATGLPQLTKQITLVQDDEEGVGFLLLLPIYSEEGPFESELDRMRTFRGWVYAPFIANSILANLNPNRVEDFEFLVYDGEISEDSLILSNVSDGEHFARAQFKEVRELSLFGQTWTIEWRSTQWFESRVSSLLPGTVFTVGILFSALLLALFVSLSRRDEVVRSLVQQKTRDLEEQNDLNASIIDTAAVAIMLIDETGIIISSNGAVKPMFNIDAAEITGQHISDLFPGYDSSFLEQRIQQYREGSTPHSWANIIAGVRLSGEPIFVDVHVNSWNNAEGQKRYTAIFQDFTELHRVSQELSATERRWNNALTGSNIGVFEIDLKTGKSIVSNTWKRMFGFQNVRDLDAQAAWRSGIHPDDRKTVEDADRACILGKTTRTSTEYRFKRADGRWIWTSSVAHVTKRDSAGKALRLVGVQLDISELKNAEAALRMSEERFRKTIHDAPIGMAIVDLDGNYVQINDALSRFLGFSAKEIVNRRPTSFTHPDDPSEFDDVVESIANGKFQVFNKDKRFIHKDGNVIWGNVSISVQYDPDGKPANLIVQIVDITEKKEAEVVKNEFIATVSHELRTPLTSIHGALKLVLGTKLIKIGDDARSLLKIAQSNSERLIDLVNDILDLEKLSSEKLPMELKEYDVCALVEMSIRDNSPIATRHEVTFELTSSEDDCRALLDEVRFKQVMTNLLSNAVKFSPEGKSVEISVARDSDQNTVVEIADHGVGIPEKFHDSIFKKFAQADSSAARKQGGTGLGLHICKQIMEQFGGSIEFDKKRKFGASFRLVIPHSETAA